MEHVDKLMKATKMTPADIDDVLLVGGSTYIPKIRELLRKYFNKVPRTNILSIYIMQQLSSDISADEVVAMGAAIQAANLATAFEKKQGTVIEGVALLDVTALPLGVEIKGYEMSVIIPANTKIPAKATGQYQTTELGQTSVRIRIFQVQLLQSILNLQHVRENTKKRSTTRCVGNSRSLAFLQLSRETLFWTLQ